VHTLLHNVKMNGMDQIVHVMSCALNDKEGYFDFNYYSDVSGSSNSQLNDSRDGTDKEFRPVLREKKFATTIDSLVASHTILPAHHIKIDVDGNEMLILHGMSRLLSGASRPLSIQIEVNTRYKAELFEFMRKHGFVETARHYTMEGQGKLERGADPEAISYNAVFSSHRPA
jgi:FkbM family methyltransferase